MGGSVQGFRDHRLDSFVAPGMSLLDMLSNRHEVFFVDALGEPLTIGDRPLGGLAGQGDEAGMWR
jgi:hypothetical protein